MKLMLSLRAFGKQNSLFPMGPAMKCCYTFHLKNRTNCATMTRKNYVLVLDGHKFEVVQRPEIHDLITCESKIVCFPRELESFIHPGELDCLDTRQLTHSHLVGNTFKLEGITECLLYLP